MSHIGEKPGPEPKYDEAMDRVTVRMPPTLRERLEQIAKREDRTLSDVIRDGAEWYAEVVGNGE